MPIEYLSFTEVAGRLGVKTGALATYKLPNPTPRSAAPAAGCQRPSTGGTPAAPAEASAADVRAKNKNE